MTKRTQASAEADADGDWEEDAFVPEVGTGTKFGWGM